MIVSQGGGVGGWCLYAHEGRLKYCYNFFGIEYYFVTADEPIPPASTRCGWSSPTTAADSARAATSPCTTTARPWAPDESNRRADGVLGGRSLRRRLRHRLADSTDYGPHGNKFTGTIDRVIIDIGEDSHDHLVTAEDKLNIAMSRQ